MFAMEDSLFETDPVDEWTMHQLRQILDQQRNLMEKLNVPPLPVVQLVAQEDVPDTCAHVDFSGEGSFGAKKAKEIRQPRRHAAVLPAEEKQNSSISAIIQPVATKTLDHHKLPPSETIFNKMAERSSTTLPAIGPQQPPIITTTHTPDNTSAPEDQQQLVNNTVGTLSGTRHTDDILVGVQSKVCHVAVVRPGRHIKTGIVKHFPWVSPAKPGTRSIPVLFRQFNKDVHPGRPTVRSDRSGSSSNGPAECFALTGQRSLKTTTTGGEALRATFTTIQRSSLLINQNNKQHNTRARISNTVYLPVAWPWDPGGKLLRVSPVWPPNTNIPPPSLAGSSRIGHQKQHRFPAHCRFRCALSCTKSTAAAGLPEKTEDVWTY